MTAQPSTPRRLHRRSDERVIAGVASGLGDYFNVDPLLIRIVLVASLVFGGLGIFLYAAAWLLVPEDSTGRSVLERFMGGDRSGLPGALVVIAAIIIGLSALGFIFGSPNGAGALVLAILVVGAGALLLQRGSADAPAAAAVSDSTATPADADAVAATQPAYVAPPRREPRPPSPLGWYVLGAALIAVGLMALASQGGIVFTPGMYAGAVLGLIGLGLVVGAWFGHARFLIVIGLLLLPFAWGASLVHVPIQGEWGQQHFAPTAADDVPDAYHLAGGQLSIDLSRIEASDTDPVTVHASVAFGELAVLVPDGATVEVDATVGGGRLRLLDQQFDNGTYLENHLVSGTGTPDFILDLDAGIGSIRVDSRDTSEDRSR